MSGYINKTLIKYLHTPPNKQQHAPHQWTVPAYGQKVQYALPPFTLPTLDKKGTTRVHTINVTYLYYARAVDSCMLTAINKFSAQ